MRKVAIFGLVLIAIICLSVAIYYPISYIKQGNQIEEDIDQLKQLKPQAPTSTIEQSQGVSPLATMTASIKDVVESSSSVPTDLSQVDSSAADVAHEAGEIEPSTTVVVPAQDLPAEEPQSASALIALDQATTDTNYNSELSMDLTPETTLSTMVPSDVATNIVSGTVPPTDVTLGVAPTTDVPSEAISDAINNTAPPAEVISGGESTIDVPSEAISGTSYNTVSPGDTMPGAASATVAPGEATPNIPNYTASPTDAPAETLKPTPTPEPVILEECKELLELNGDYVGWLTIDKTAIDYPVLQTNDEEYYLTHDFYGKKNSNGQLILDGECDVKAPSYHLVISGHNMKSGKMFNDLLNYASKSYWQNRKTFQFNSVYRYSEYVVFAAFYSKNYDEDEDGFRYNVDINYAYELNTYLDSVDAEKRYDTGIDVKFGDELITLTTCSENTRDGRFVVVARKIREGEEF